MGLSVPDLQSRLEAAGVRSSKANNFLRTKRDMWAALSDAETAVLLARTRQVGSGAHPTLEAAIGDATDAHETKRRVREATRTL